MAADEVLLFRHSSDHLVTYNIKSKRIVTETRIPQTRQYEFPDRGEFYTTGDSSNFGFKIIKTTGNSIISIIDAGPREGLFPIASNGSTRVFSIVYYDSRGDISDQQLARLDGNSLKPYTHVTGAVKSGVMIEKTLYYTTTRPDASAGYQLYSVPLDDLNESPVLVDASLTKGDLYQFRDKLIIDHKIQGTSISLPCDYYCYVDEDAGFLYSLHPNKDQNLSLDLMNLATRKVSALANGDIIDFRVQGTSVTVYMTGKVAGIEVNTLS